MATQPFNKIDLNKQSMQMVYKDRKTKVSYIYESLHTPKYTRNICLGPIKIETSIDSSEESDEETEEEFEYNEEDYTEEFEYNEEDYTEEFEYNEEDYTSNSVHDLEDFEISDDLDDTSYDAYSLSDNDIWGAPKHTENMYEEFDTISEQDEMLDSFSVDEETDEESNGVIYTQDDVKLIHKGEEYKGDYFLEEYNNFVQYDELLVKQPVAEYEELKTKVKIAAKAGQLVELYDNKGKQLTAEEVQMKLKNLRAQKVFRKYTIGDPEEISNITIKMLPLTTFLASKGCHPTGAHMQLVDGKTCRVQQYENEKGETYSEFISVTGDIVKQIFNNDECTITFNILGTSEASISTKSHICKKKLDVDYTVEEMDSINNKNIQKFQIRRDNKAIYLPHPSYFLKQKNMEYVKTANYEIVDTPNKLIDLVEYLLKTYPDKKRVIGYDAETEGLQFHRFMKKHHQLVTHCISWEDNHSVIIPVRMLNEQNINPQEAVEILRPILEEYPILCHNGAADVRFNMYDGLDINLQEDTMVLIKHILPFINDRKVTGFGKAIDDLLWQFNKEEMIDLHKEVYKPSGVDFNFALLNRDYMIVYGCPDTDRMRILWKNLRPKLDPKQEAAYHDHVIFSKQVAINSTFSGLGVNVDAIQKEKEKAQDLVDTVESVFYRYTGKDKSTFSLTSAVQRKNYIFGEMGAPLSEARRTPSGDISADKIVVERLSKWRKDVPTDYFKADITDIDGKVIVSKDELNRLKYPECKLIRIHGDLKKNITAFYNGMLDNSIDGVYYEDFRCGATNTYRTTGRIQITKSSLKYYMGAYDEDYNWCSTDYAAEEFRLAANQSEDWTLINTLKDKEADPHTMVASELYNKPPYKVSKKERKKIKSANFGILYGMGPRALACNIFGVDTPSEEQLAEARDLYELYCYKRCLMLKELTVAKDFVTFNGYQTNNLEFKMVYPDITDVKDYINKVFKHVSEGEKKSYVPLPVVLEEKKAKFLGKLLNACGNYPIQSWAAGTLMQVLPALVNIVRQDGYGLEDVAVPLQVHDEVGVESNKHKVHPYYLIKVQNEAMVADLSYLNKDTAPLYIGIGFGTNWGEAKGDNEELPVELQYRLIEEWNNGTCPSIEEINKVGVHDHMMQRVYDYMRERAHNLFQDMVDAHHFVRQEMQYRLNHNMFVGKKLNELFGTNDSFGEILISEYLRIIYGFEKSEEEKEVISKYKKLMNGTEDKKEKVALNKQMIEEINTILQPTYAELGITWEEGEVREEESTLIKSPDEIQEFFYIDDIPTRVNVSEENVIIDVSDLYGPTVSRVKKYVEVLCTTEYNVHNKQLIYKLNGKFEYTDKQMLGIPANFNDILERIIQGDDISISYTGNKPVVSIQEVPVYVDTELNGLIIDVRKCKSLGPSALNDICNIVMKYSSRAAVASIPIYVKGDITKDSQLRLINVSQKMLDEIDRYIQTCHITTDMAQAESYGA